MLLNWKKVGLKVVDLIPIDESGRSLAAGVSRLTIILAPGVNEVTDKEYALMRPHIQDSLDQGTLEQVRVDGIRVRSLRDVPIRQAVDIVKEAISPLTLSLWLETDPRDAVHAAVMKRMDVLNIQTVPVDASLVKAIAEQNEIMDEGKKAPPPPIDDDEPVGTDSEDDVIPLDEEEDEPPPPPPPVKKTKKRR